jgi:hypothetical protein
LHGIQELKIEDKWKAPHQDNMETGGIAIPDTRWRWMINFTPHPSALHMRKEPLVLSGQEAERAPQSVWMWWWKDKSLFPPGTEPMILQPFCPYWQLWKRPKIRSTGGLS